MKAATMPIRCGPTRCSNWRWIGCPRMGNCARNRRSRGWKTCPTGGRCCALGRALIEQYCASFRQPPKRIVLDIDDTFDRVHGGQQLRLFNAFHDDYGFQPIVVFDGEGRFVTAMLRPGKRPSGQEIRAFVRRLVGALRALGPKVEILLRADSHYAGPQVFDWCHANLVDWVFGLAPNAALSRHVAALEKSTAERFKAAPLHGKRRCFVQFYDAA